MYVRVCLLWVVAMVTVVSQAQVSPEPTMARDAACDCPGHQLRPVWSSLLWTPFPAHGLPLFLSPLIHQGRIREAQEKSYVGHLTSDPIDSYSGYLTVDSRYDSNLFFWFFPAQTNASDAPLLLWLNGGPGRSSVFGALLENGPLELTEEGKLKRRAVSWTKHFSMLYVDNPVKTGYSFTKLYAGMSKSKEDVAQNLYSLLIQFLKLFPQYSRNDFYFGGQSYAGKYVPALGVYVHDKNVQSPPPEISINFKGIYLGGGFCDPEHMFPVFPDYLFHAGMISRESSRTMRQALLEKITVEKALDEGVSFENIIIGENFTGEYIDTDTLESLGSLDNLLGADATNVHLIDPLQHFMRSSFARLKLHVGYAITDIKPNYEEDVDIYLDNDFYKSTNKENALLMDNYKVLHYSGNLDAVVNVPMTEAFLDHVPWSGREEYRRSVRKPWMVNDTVVGWTTVVKNFTRVVVRNAGHMVPYDRPEAALDMMRRFVFDQSF